MVDADNGRCLITELLAQPFGETTPRPVPPRTGRRLNRLRRA